MCVYLYQTDFADWSWEEFKRYRLGAPQNCSATQKDNYQLTDSTSKLPSEVLYIHTNIKYYLSMHIVCVSVSLNIKKLPVR